jgi:hypothetical protein
MPPALVSPNITAGMCTLCLGGSCYSRASPFSDPRNPQQIPIPCHSLYPNCQPLPNLNGPSSLACEVPYPPFSFPTLIPFHPFQGLREPSALHIHVAF